MDQKEERKHLVPILCIVILLMGASVIVTVVVLINVLDLKDTNCSPVTVTDDNQLVDDSKLKDSLDLGKCDDIAIVGAGAGGSYTAYRLRKKGLKISVYEQLNRIGGRLFSVKIPGVKARAELGGMRFQITDHKRLVKYVEELKITYRPFTSSKENDRVYHLRGKNFRQEELISKELPYELRDDEKGKYWSGILSYYNKEIFGNISSDQYMTKTRDGTPLWKIGYNNEISKVASSEALRYVLDTELHDVFSLESVNGDFHPFAYQTEDHAESDPEYFTITEGMQTFPERLIEEFLAESSKHSIHLNHQVKSLELLETEPEKIYKMRYKDMSSSSKEWKSTCAKKVVLALPQPALKKLWWEDTIKGQYFVDNVESVIPVHGLKAYFAYDHPWWRTDGNGEVFREIDTMKHAITDLPLRQALDVEAHPEGLNNTGKSLLLASYAVSVASLSFRDLILKNTGLDDIMVASDPGMYVNKLFVAQLNNYLARIFNISESDLPQPYAAAVQYWGDAAIHEACVHLWRAGYKWTEVMNHMVKPSNDEAIYICGEAFSAYHQAWVEGALEVCDVMLEKHFGM